MEGGQSGEIPQPITSENAVTPLLPPQTENLTSISEQLQAGEKQKYERTRRPVRQLIFQAGLAIATALPLFLMHAVPVSASGMQGYEVRPVGYTIDTSTETPAGVLTHEQHQENLPANYYGGSFSTIESQAMGSILPEELIYNLPGQRSVEAWKILTDHLDVAENPRYAPREGKTYCNFYVRDALREFGVAIPVTYTDPKTGETKPTLANNIHDSMTRGSFTEAEPDDLQKEWQSIDEKLAQEMADLGIPVILSVKNLSGGPGHVALLAPTGIAKSEEIGWNSQDQGEGASGTFIVSQSGGKNGILKWNDEHYSEENGYSQRMIFVNTEDYSSYLALKNSTKIKASWQTNSQSPLSAQAVLENPLVEQVISSSSDPIPPLPAVGPQLSPEE